VSGKKALPPGNVPNPDLLKQYAIVAPELPALVMAEWGHRHRRAFWYALVSLVIGGVLALSLVGGFIYLVMNDHGGYAGGLLGAGALGRVAGFRSTRLDKE